MNGSDREKRARDLERFGSSEIRNVSGRRDRRRNAENLPEETPENDAFGRNEGNGQRPYPERRRRKNAVVPVLLAVLITAVIVGVVTYLVAYRNVEEEFKYSRQPVVVEEDEAMTTLRSSLENGDSVTTALRSSFKNYMVIYQEGRYRFVPVNYDLKMHDRVGSNVKKISENEWEYRENGKTVSYKGIDVSSHQGDIDWGKVADDGVEFAIIRAVYRGYESGKLVVDTAFDANAKNAAEAGIAAGAYLFSQAVNEKEMDEEIDLLLETVSPYEINGPLVLDIELTEGENGRADSLTVEERTALAVHFCERVREEGCRPMLYFNFESAMTLVDLEQLEDYDKWYASYTTDFYYPYYYTVWQYSNTGTVNGIEGDVDMDMSFEKFW